MNYSLFPSSIYTVIGVESIITKLKAGFHIMAGVITASNSSAHLSMPMATGMANILVDLLS